MVAHCGHLVLPSWLAVALPSPRGFSRYGSPPLRLSLRRLATSRIKLATTSGITLTMNSASNWSVACTFSDILTVPLVVGHKVRGVVS